MSEAPDEFDKLAYRFWSIHPRDIPKAGEMPERYPGGQRAWFYAKEMRDHALALVAAEREACARLVGSMFAPGSEEEVTCDVAAAAIRARGSTDAEALREARRVKPLEWKGRGAFCDFGVWQIVTDDDGDFGYRFSGSPTVTFWHWKTEAEAKAAAQADYERRILSALIPEDT